MSFEMFKAFCLCPAIKTQPAKSTTQRAIQYVRHYRISASGPWTIEDDIILRNYRGPKTGTSWRDFVQSNLPHRTIAQCRNRWAQKYKNAEPTDNVLKKHQFNNALQEDRGLKVVARPSTGKRRLRVAWTTEEDDILIRAVDVLGPQWAHISRDVITHRSASTLRNRYYQLQAQRTEWTDTELRLLNECALACDQDWSQVAKELGNGKTATLCRDKWLDIQPEHMLTEKKDKDGEYIENWKQDELSTFWRKLHDYGGDFAKVAAKLPGRNEINCRYKFWATLRFDVDFLNIYGREVEKSSQDSPASYRARVASLYSEWLRIRMSPMWPEDQLRRLEELARNRRGMKKNLVTADWQIISKRFPGKSLYECRHQYLNFTSVNFEKKSWQFDELLRLVELVCKYKVEMPEGEDMWARVAKELNTGRSPSVCQARYNYMKLTGHRFVI